MYYNREANADDILNAFAITEQNRLSVVTLTRLLDTAELEIKRLNDLVEALSEPMLDVESEDKSLRITKQEASHACSCKQN
tara:strand:+ start:479 stop:721 length:243 start_codon:yes stop_codon:yes gene_type:complete